MEAGNKRVRCENVNAGGIHVTLPGKDGVNLGVDVRYLFFQESINQCKQTVSYAKLCPSYI